MGVEMIRDNHGSDKFVLQNNELYNDAIIAQNLEGYEIIKILNKYAVEDEEVNYELKKNFVSKVVSKNNSKTYALKKICSDYLPSEEGWEKKLSRNFRIINQVQNATKYYTYFLENDDLYMVYEFVDNLDISGFIESYRNSDKKIEPDVIYNIFVQCLYGLKCLHDKKILHRNIKLSNIFMTDNKVIKIGDFGFNFELENYNDDNEKYKAPEMITGEKFIYDEACDVYAMGKVFQYLCYFSFLFEPDGQVDEDMDPDAIDLYGSDIINIIKQMLNEDPSLRPSAKDLYNSIRPQYINNIAKLSSINSIFHCINSFSNFSEQMSKKANSFNEKATPFSYNYYNCSQFFSNGKYYDDYAEYLNNFRELFTKNIQIDNNTEIKPRLILEFLLEKLNKETANKLSRDSFSVQQIEFDKDKKKALEKFNKNFNENFDSLISKFFVGKIITERICQNDKAGFYSFTAFPFIEFDMERCQNIKSIENWFTAQKNLKHILKLEENVFCSQCNQIQEHIELKQFETFPQNFIISLNWRDINPYPINIPEQLDLSKDIIEDPFSPKKFELVGIVKKLFDEKNEEYYIAIYKEKNSWMVSAKKEISKCNNIKESAGVPFLLFYSSKIDIGM
jgi:NIMA (never in mitosis gene a)-related kinase